MKPLVRATETALNLGERIIPLDVRRNRRARRISLRVDPIGPKLVLVLPSNTPLRHGLDFVEEKAVWVQNRLARAPMPVPFADGVEIPYLGVPHVIRHRPGERGGVWREAGEIHVSGDAAHLPRRMTDWLKSEAKRVLTDATRDKAARLGVKVARVTVRDTRSRWGSCSSSGGINFSWRLILAPDWVLDYVVAHEVAHMAEMNHSPAFWAIVARLTDHLEAGRPWLKNQGSSLHRYGAGPTSNKGASIG